jgi:hypothetical protein
VSLLHDHVQGPGQVIHAVYHRQGPAPARLRCFLDALTAALSVRLAVSEAPATVTLRPAAG